MDYSQNNKFKNIVAGMITLFGEVVLTRSPDEIMMINQIFMDSGRPDVWRYNLDEKSKKIFEEYMKNQENQSSEQIGG